MEIINKKGYEDYLIKAILCEDNKTVVTGFYTAKVNPNNNEEYIPYIKPLYEETNYEINPFTICKNTNIKDKNKKDVYEFDLVNIYKMGQLEGIGYVTFDSFYNGCIVRTLSGMYNLNNIQIEVIGNVILNDDDYNYFEKKSNKINENSFIDKSICIKRKPLKF